MLTQIMIWILYYLLLFLKKMQRYTLNLVRVQFLDILTIKIYIRINGFYPLSQFLRYRGFPSERGCGYPGKAVQFIRT